MGFSGRDPPKVTIVLRRAGEATILPCIFHRFIGESTECNHRNLVGFCNRKGTEGFFGRVGTNHANHSSIHQCLHGDGCTRTRRFSIGDHQTKAQSTLIDVEQFNTQLYRVLFTGCIRRMNACLWAQHTDLHGPCIVPTLC